MPIPAIFIALTPQQPRHNDIQVINELLDGEEKDVHGDKVFESKERHFLNSKLCEQLWCMPFKKQMGHDLPEWHREIDRFLSSLRAKG